MEAIVNYVWGSSRTDIKDAGNELTENIAMLKELAPSDIHSIPEESREALLVYGSVKFGLLEDVRRTGKGYELLAIWMNALYDFAQHTGQLERRVEEQQDEQEEEDAAPVDTTDQVPSSGAAASTQP